ncbi:MAG: glycerate kinase [Verrucomicrobiota bacterium]
MKLLRILIIPDKFKGTLSAREAAAAMAAGWHASRPGDRLEQFPMSDGGDGFGELLSAHVGGQEQRVQTVDAAQRPCESAWWWEAKTRTAIIESARTVGLAMLPPGQFHPFQLDTRGLGTMLFNAAEKQARTCIIGIGGSATNDGGFGLARALGWVFLDGEHNALSRWTELSRLKRILPPTRGPLFPNVIVAVDVQNPLLGARGCSRIYGPQKGLRPEDLPIADAALQQLARVVRQQFGRDLAKEPGAGAAGGLGFGLLAFLNAQAAPGFALFAKRTRLPQRLRRADLVITGEGAMDGSTLMGKGVGELGALCRQAKVPCIGLCGTVAGHKQLKKLFRSVNGLTDLTTPEEAKANAAHWLQELARREAEKAGVKGLGGGR